MRARTSVRPSDNSHFVSSIGIGIIGLGNVGGGALEIIADNGDQIAQKLGRPLEVRAICSRSLATNPPKVADMFPAAKRTADWRAVVNDPDIHIVAELVGGTDVAAEIIASAAQNGKSVVTANKELMALRGAELWASAQSAGVGLAMEASVAGGIPILTAIREGIAGDRIQSLLGILNGTCNYILTEMERRGDSLETVLTEAQELGYAEADPTADVDGYDARSKLAILAGLAFGARIDPESIPTEGIRRIRDIDFRYAARLDHTVRLIAKAESAPEGLFLSVRPALLPRDTILAKVVGSYNSVWIKGAHGADTFYYGRGAGPTPTGVAVVSDIIGLARELGGTPRSPFAYGQLQRQQLAPIRQETLPYYVRFRVRDRPGILAAISEILAESSISIDAVLQEPADDKADLPFVMTLDPTPGHRLETAMAKIRSLEFLVDPPLALPLESGFGG